MRSRPHRRQPPQNTYRAYYATSVSRTISGITTSGNGSNKVATITTTSSHGFHVGQTITLSGTSKSVYDGVSFVIDTVPGGSQFTIKPGSGGTAASAGTVTNSQAQQSISLSRSGTTATATGLANNWFTNGDALIIAKTGGTATNEAAYENGEPVTITCSGTCNAFTYPVPVSPGSPGTFGGTPTISLVGSTGTIAAGGITRSLGSNTASGVMTISSGTFANGDTVSIASSGTAVNTESAYVGSYTISCSTSTCSTFTFSGFTLTPTTTGSGSMSVYSGSTPPDRDTVIKWLRGRTTSATSTGRAVRSQCAPRSMPTCSIRGRS